MRAFRFVVRPMRVAKLPSLHRRRVRQQQRGDARRGTAALPPQGLADPQIARSPIGYAAEARGPRRQRHRDEIGDRRVSFVMFVVVVVNVRFRHESFPL